MGIKDLLRFMKPYVEPIHINKYADKRVGIDAYSWLHKGAYSCSMEICLDTNGDKKLRYLQYFMHRIKLLQFYKIIPVVVFDGGNLPCKSATEDDRNKKRVTNLDLAMAKYKEGNIPAAVEFFQRAVSITPLMAYKIIQILKLENIEFVVAPYEADAQLAYLSSIDAEEGGISAVITEDSDLLAYGCKAVIFKMDRDGNGDEIILDNAFDSLIQKPSFRNFNKEIFTGMCVLAGCDFLPSISGIGIAKAHVLVSKYRNIERVFAVLKMEKGNQMPEHYLESFREALAVFQHAQIYDIGMKMLRHMTPVPDTLLETFNGKLDFLGPEISPSTTVAIAEGKLNPITKEVFDEAPVLNHHSKKDHSFRSSSPRKRIHAPIVERFEETGFAVLSSSCEAILITGKKTKDMSVMKEWDHLTEATSLAKLAFQKENKTTLQKLATPTEYISLKMPDNNPFKKRVVCEVQPPPETEISSEQYSEVTKQYSDNNPFKKRALCKVQSPPEIQISNEQNSEVLYVEDDSVKTILTLESQESVASKAIKISGEDKTSEWVCLNLDMKKGMDCNATESVRVTQRTRRAKKLKKTSSKTANDIGKNSSILNFFSRTM